MNSVCLIMRYFHKNKHKLLYITPLMFVLISHQIRYYSDIIIDFDIPIYKYKHVCIKLILCLDGEILIIFVYTNAVFHKRLMSSLNNFSTK